MPDRTIGGTPSPIGAAIDPAELAPGLYWAINSRFLRYLARMPDGRYSATDGADLIGGRVFHFEPAPGTEFDASTGSGVLRFRGDVRFGGHHGFLFVRVADPCLIVDHGSATLSVATHPTEPERLTLVTADLAAEADGPAHRISGTNIRLTAAGATLFNDVYPAGTSLDDLAVLGHR